ncbi:hypothetical protein [Aliiglaciecola sp. M165]|uniref:hypothetical protein n=1 Tax=Aliiglaciecola sp. M165 TaxID=2593649 RepID=UPI001180D9B9|nr:hypothetical protein [Aliiglaciecola sp. M165]TRY30357.1 hypothetical protein FM019_16235 [Aliiglaciecola sp. M165]
MRIIVFLLICTLCSAMAYQVGKSNALKNNTEVPSSKVHESTEKEERSTDATPASSDHELESGDPSTDDDVSLESKDECLSSAEFNEQADTLVTQYKKTERELTETKSALRDANATLKEAGLEVPQTLTREEIEKSLPAPFTDVIAGADLGIRKNYEEFSNQQRNEEWAIEMETNIRDFFSLHELSINVDLDSVICKSSFCEIRGFEKAPEVFPVIIRELSMQPWYSSGQGSFSNFTPYTPGIHNEDNKAYFYVLAVFKSR